MISAHLLIMYVTALVVVFALPGPDMALVLQTSIGRGARNGFAAAVGLGLSRATHVTLSACGVAALLRNAPWLYEVVRYGGAIYLAWVAVQIFRSPMFALPSNGAQAGDDGALRTAFVKGLFTNLLNPKALLFCSVLLPQFVRPEAGPVAWQMVELGVVLVALGACFDAVYAIGAARIAGWVRAHPLAQSVQRWTFSAALIGFALRLSLD
ncbi:MULTISPECIES: LysE family translocator [Paraburkholderia]|jgi:threonine/homoserine/homoserine lactone efflux protein|uniref:LysE family translocator n=1 Tax=Paraburkholderia caribensis TaxID=75105 RepID=A0A9Q6S7Q6_9BURK|nr:MULTISPECIES: LysE family translocator [Paraburkholderia]ALP66530.1 lysine transporter LysE [Paraburkholderia caribensis]AMV45089.1 lysine transporter LysE [Paraburkholderia caribensis]AUT54235.1 LysE family translocator [Paraburkholderia caribensis]MCO4882017.1 LysE family translocator [Paraburkholderia caribensis]MDR6386961.1 threonine/homoserine/homoserine lactone efflux protein [Paraburkholderia caribensis]